MERTPPHRPLDDSRTPVARAHADALACLARRPLFSEELRSRLLQAGHGRATVDGVLERLRAAGQLDDSALARHTLAARADRLGHGPLRLIEDLRRRGVDSTLAEAAWSRAVQAGDIDPAALLRRQIGRRLGPRALAPDGAALRRVYNALLRAGFEEPDVRRELQPFRQDPDPTLDDGSQHDID